MNELNLPPAPPLPPDARDRALRTVLDAMSPPAPARGRRWAPLLTAAAVVLVAAASVTVATSSDDAPAGPALLPPAPGTPAPAPATGPVLAPLPDAERPAPSGDPATDAALTRCATAVVRSGHSAEYPPTAGWHSTLHVGTGAVESELTVDDSFGCLVTPGSVAVSGTGADAATGVRVVRMSPYELVVLNPRERRFTLGSGDEAWSDTARVSFLPMPDLSPGGAPTPLEDLPLTVNGGSTGTVGEVVPALTVVDRDLPHRADTPDGAELASCLARPTSDRYTDPGLWIPTGRHDSGGTEPDAVLARIGDIAVGYCVDDPGEGPTFRGAPLPPPSDRPRRILLYRGGGSALLITAPPGVTRVEVRPSTGAGAAHPCTITDGLAMCTLADDSPVSDANGQYIAVTAYTTTDPQGIPM
jgi:hypothetical protein